MPSRACVWASVSSSSRARSAYQVLCENASRGRTFPKNPRYQYSSASESYASAEVGSRAIAFSKLALACANASGVPLAK